MKLCLSMCHPRTTCPLTSFEHSPEGLECCLGRERLLAHPEEVLPAHFPFHERLEGLGQGRGNGDAAGGALGGAATDKCLFGLKQRWRKVGIVRRIIRGRHPSRHFIT